MSRRMSICAGAMLLLPWVSVHALRAADVPPPSPEAVRAANPPAPAQRQGRVSAVDAAGQRVEIDGVWWRVVEGQTHIYRQGRTVGMAVFAKGQVLSFGVAADTAVLGVVHVP